MKVSFWAIFIGVVIGELLFHALKALVSWLIGKCKEKGWW